MKNYWKVNDSVISALDRAVEDKRDDELVRDYKELKDAPYSHNFYLQFLSFSVVPAITAFLSTIIISQVKPEWIQIILDELNIGLDINNIFIALGLTILNFYLTFASLTNIVNININKRISSNPNSKTLTRSNKKSLEKNLNSHIQNENTPFMNYISRVFDTIRVDKQAAKSIVSKNNSLVWRKLKSEPVGTNLIYPLVLFSHRKEIEKRNIFMKF